MRKLYIALQVFTILALSGCAHKYIIEDCKDMMGNEVANGHCIGYPVARLK